MTKLTQAERLTPAEIEAIRERADKATAGEWRYYPSRLYSHDMVSVGGFDGKNIAEIKSNESDGRFIAHAREDIPKLVAEIERLRERLFVCESLLSEAHDIMDDVHLYETELYEEITKYFDGEEVE